MTKLKEYQDLKRAIKDIESGDLKFLNMSEMYVGFEGISISGRSDIVNGINIPLIKMMVLALNDESVKNVFLEHVVGMLEEKTKELRPIALKEAQKNIEEI